jgi:hypothetical protein
MEEMRNAYGKSEKNTPLGRPRCRWKDDIKTYLVINQVRVFGLDASGSG